MLTNSYHSLESQRPFLMRLKLSILLRCCLTKIEPPIIKCHAGYQAPASAGNKYLISFDVGADDGWRIADEAEADLSPDADVIHLVR